MYLTLEVHWFQSKLYAFCAACHQSYYCLYFLLLFLCVLVFSVYSSIIHYLQYLYVFLSGSVYSPEAQWAGAVVSTDACRVCIPGVRALVCVEFAPSPCVCVGSLWLTPTAQRHMEEDNLVTPNWPWGKNECVFVSPEMRGLLVQRVPHHIHLLHSHQLFYLNICVLYLILMSCFWFIPTGAACS